MKIRSYGAPAGKLHRCGRSRFIAKSTRKPRLTLLRGTRGKLTPDSNDGPDSLRRANSKSLRHAALEGERRAVFSLDLRAGNAKRHRRRVEGPATPIMR